jgi:hypothetical protein
MIPRKVERRLEGPQLARAYRALVRRERRIERVLRRVKGLLEKEVRRRGDDELPIIR